MRRRAGAFGFALVFLMPFGALAADNIPSSTVSFHASDRLLVLAPHPGDETVGSGGAIQMALRLKIPVKVVYFTDGDHDEWMLKPKVAQRMGVVRRDEALSACRALGLADGDVEFLEIPDGVTETIFTSRWGVTTATPKGQDVLARLIAVLRAFHPTKVILPHPGDEMPDHRAMYLFARVALWSLPDSPATEILPYLVGTRFRGWPRPIGYFPDDALEAPPDFGGTVVWRALPIDKEDAQRSYVALQSHRTLFDRGDRPMSSFVRRNALYGDFFKLTAAELDGPAVDISQKGPEFLRPSSQLTPLGRAKWVGIARRALDVEGTEIVQTFTLTRPLDRGVKEVVLVVTLVGFSADVPFEQMPKLTIKIGRKAEVVFNGDALALGAGVTVVRKDRTVTVRCLLRGLGYPEKLMTSAQTRMGGVTLDTIPWRIIEGLERP